MITVRPADTFEQRVGRCFELAGRAFVMFGRTGDVLVHGSIEGYGFPRLSHAWVQMRTGTVYEPITADAYSPDEFAAFFHPEVEHSYSLNEAAAHMLSSNHYGPWEPMLHP